MGSVAASAISGDILPYISVAVKARFPCTRVMSCVAQNLPVNHTAAAFPRKRLDATFYVHTALIT